MDKILTNSFFYRNILLLFLIQGLFFNSCTRETFIMPPINVLDTITYQPTPYKLNVPKNLGTFPNPGFELTEEGVALGKMLFFDPLLSRDNSLSCASCHNQQFAFTDNGKKFSTGVRGLEGTKNSMALFNLGFYRDFFWDGRTRGLEDQALKPVIDHLEMDDTWSNVVNKLRNHPNYPKLFRQAFRLPLIDSSQVVNALAQFELTLISGNSKFDRWKASLEPLTPQEQLGLNIFKTEPRMSAIDNPGGDCFHCHGDPLFTSLEFLNNGLDANPSPGLGAVTGRSSDIGKFKVPSLRNIEKTAPYMHDGRFETLEEVVEFYNSGVEISPTIAPIMSEGDTTANTPGIANGLNLTNAEKAALVAFLKTLTDDEFLNNPVYAPN